MYWVYGKVHRDFWILGSKLDSRLHLGCRIQGKPIWYPYNLSHPSFKTCHKPTPFHSVASPASGHVDSTTAIPNPATIAGLKGFTSGSPDSMCKIAPETMPTVMKKKSQRDLDWRQAGRKPCCARLIPRVQGPQPNATYIYLAKPSPHSRSKECMDRAPNLCERTVMGCEPARTLSCNAAAAHRPGLFRRELTGANL